MKKTRYTKQQMLAIYADWQQSGLCKKSYCHQIGLATSTFFYWVKKFELQEKTSADGSVTSGFTELAFSAKDDHAGIVLEIEYPSGTKLKLYRQAEANWIKTLL